MVVILIVHLLVVIEIIKDVSFEIILEHVNSVVLYESLNTFIVCIYMFMNHNQYI
jgi:hypothetical protein